MEKRYEVVLFSAGLSEYASAVVDQLDPQRTIRHRLYRDACTEMRIGDSVSYVKDLSRLGRDLKGVLIVDDNPGAYRLQPQNALRVSYFVDDPHDRELDAVINFLQAAQHYDDIREAIRLLYVPKQPPPSPF